MAVMKIRDGLCFAPRGKVELLWPGVVGSVDDSFRSTSVGQESQNLNSGEFLLLSALPLGLISIIELWRANNTTLAFLFLLST